MILITQYMIFLNYISLCNFEESYIELPNEIHDKYCFFKYLLVFDVFVGSSLSMMNSLKS